MRALPPREGGRSYHVHLEDVVEQPSTVKTSYGTELDPLPLLQIERWDITRYKNVAVRAWRH